MPQPTRRLSGSWFLTGRPSRRGLAVSLAALVLLLCVSCQAGPTLHPVRGAVLFKDKPVEGAMVVFHPADSNAPMPSGKTGANGSFSLLTPGHGEGAPAGDYIVLITLYPPTTEDGEELPKNQLPDRYADHAAGLLKATVRPGPNELEPFKLTVK